MSTVDSGISDDPVLHDLALRQSTGPVASALASLAPTTPLLREAPVFNGATSARVRVNGRRFCKGAVPFGLQGVTYGPFAPDSSGDPLPPRHRVIHDFLAMGRAGINAIRIYHPPPPWFIDLAEEHAIHVLIDIPCPKHLDFLDDSRALRDARRRVQQIVAQTSGRSCVIGCSVGNEISPELTRWYGARRIEPFIQSLVDVAHQADPEALITYANFPPTEYLELPFLDFRMFNVYLHDPSVFRRYLLRLLNQGLDRPLVLGELGMDTLRNGEAHQAEFLRGHSKLSSLLGVAGAFVFSWTDDWYTNNWQIDDWAFGVTRRDRTPKISYEAVGHVFRSSPADLLQATPRVSVVVCSYNGASTLEQCLTSLQSLRYPDYEVILVDDGSTDNTRQIAAKFPSVRAIHQENLGLSAARNAGLHAATGQIIAYTDSDCFADPDWLAVLVDQLQHSGAAGVGGPNLTPDDGRLAGCVACAPGQPTHVLETDDEAEHIPGCNMAFQKEALLAIGAFDPIYRKAGDDVDVCWRLREAGYRITFSPGAFVWHHRRQTPRAYLKQQIGYGEAEALLARKHPERFNALGNGKWRGMLYGDGLTGIRLGRRRVHGGVFGQGLFQTLYQPEPAHWAMLPSTLEWHVAAIAMLGASLAGAPLEAISCTMLGLTFLVTLLQAAQARPPAKYDGLGTRIVIGLLCWLQPLVRSFKRYRTRLGSLVVPAEPDDPPCSSSVRVSRYITMDGVRREDYVRKAADELARRGMRPALDSGWSPWDAEIPCGPGSHLQVRTVQEFYQGNSAQIGVGFQLRRTALFKSTLFAAFCAGALGLRCLSHHHWIKATIGLSLAILLAALCGVLWRHGSITARRAAAVFDLVAQNLGMTPHSPKTDTTQAP